MSEWSGALVVDKPAGWTSHDIVNKVRRIAQTKKVGHLGTLDPMATGVLPLLVGRCTRLAQYFSARDKVYEAGIALGYSTDTYDAEGTPTSPIADVLPEPQLARAVLERFCGRIQQVPPAVSAKKVHGVPAYKLARANRPVELPAVEVEIISLEILEQNSSYISARIHCSSGTYIRSIAHDLGVALGCGAHLRSLRRTSSGEYKIEQAHSIEALAELSREGRLGTAMLPAAELLPELPVEVVSEETAVAIRHGREFRTSPFLSPHGSPMIKAVSHSHELLAISRALLPGVYRPVCVL